MNLTPRKTGSCDWEEPYFPKLNSHFLAEVADPDSTFVPWLEERHPEDYFCFKYTRIVTKE